MLAEFLHFTFIQCVPAQIPAIYFCIFLHIKLYSCTCLLLYSCTCLLVYSFLTCCAPALNPAVILHKYLDRYFCLYKLYSNYIFILSCHCIPAHIYYIPALSCNIPALTCYIPTLAYYIPALYFYILAFSCHISILSCYIPALVYYISAFA